MSRVVIKGLHYIAARRYIFQLDYTKENAVRPKEKMRRRAYGRASKVRQWSGKTANRRLLSPLLPYSTNCMAIELGRTTKIYINIWHYNGKRQYITGLAKYTCVCCIAWELLWLSHLVDGQNQTDG